MPAQLLHQAYDVDQDFFGTVLLEVLLQDSLLQKVPNVLLLVRGGAA